MTTRTDQEYDRNRRMSQGDGDGARRREMNRPGQNYDRDNQWAQRQDYDEPIWTYTEVWLIPDPMTGRGPQGYQLSDERIKEDVCDRLTRHGQLDASNITVEISDCEVTLTGTMPDRQSKRIAEDTVESISGVRDVHNQLRIWRQDEQQNNDNQQAEQGSQVSESAARR